MKQITAHTFKLLLSKAQAGISGAYIVKSFRVMCILVVMLGASMFSLHHVSAQESGPQEASPGNIFTYCDSPTFYFGLHCQIGDKTYAGWYDKGVPPSLPRIANLKIVNVVNNPEIKGKLTIYTPTLYCDLYWAERIGSGFIQINKEKFPTCKNQRGMNKNAKYLYSNNGNLVRIITDIQVKYGDSVKFKVFGSIYDHIRDDCRSEKFGWCEYPGISSGWVYAYSKTGIREGELASFYRQYSRLNGKRIYDFLTIKFSDMDLDVNAPDYYDYNDYRMTFAIAPN